jgi:hypothetical protein
MTRLLVLLALSMPAYAQAPMVTAELDCGSLVGKGSVRLLLGSEIKATIEIVCGLKSA